MQGVLDFIVTNLPLILCLITGIGLLVLFRSLRIMRETFTVVCISYVLSALTGAVIGLLF